MVEFERSSELTVSLEEKFKRIIRNIIGIKIKIKIIK